jgi:hypothetical protein
VSQNPPSPFWFNRVRPWLSALLFLFAFGYRLLGIGWGLPNELHNQSYHPDEQVIWEFSQGVKPAQFHFTPGKYNYGTLYLTVLRIGSDVIAGYGGGPKQNDIKSFWAYIAECDLFGRLVSALAGAGTVVVIFLMMRRFTRVLGAFAAALFVAVAPAFVVHSRFQTVDVTATFLLALSLYYATLLIPATYDFPAKPRKENAKRTFKLNIQEPMRSAILSGLFAGLSAGTKYTGILAVFSLLAALAFTWKAGYLKIAAAGLGVAILAFVVATPGSVLDNAAFIRDVKYEMAHTSSGHGLAFVNVGSGYLYNIGVNLVQGIDLLLVLVSIVAIFVAIFKKQRWVWVLIAFSLPYYILISRGEVFFLRYTFPLYIVLAGAFGWWVGYAHERKGWNIVVVCISIIALGLCFRSSSVMTGWMMGTDPRDQAAGFFKSMSAASPQTTVGLVSDPWFYSPALIPDSAMRRGAQELQDKEMQASTAPHVEQFLPRDQSPWDSRLIAQSHPDYITFSSFEAYDPDRLKNATNLHGGNDVIVNRFKQFQTLLEQQYNQVEPPITVSPAGQYDIPGMFVEDLEYIHPILWIWKRKDLH